MKMKSSPLNRSLLVCFAWLFPAIAQAHLVTTGFGTFYDGMAHLALTPADWLMVLGLGLWAGLSGAPAGRAVLLALPAGWLAGELIGQLWPAGGEWPVLMVLSFGLAGAGVAADWKLSPPVIVCLAVAFGALHGYVDGATMTGSRTWLGLIGIASAVFVMATLLPAIVVSLRPRWTRIGVRVVGSWIVASGLLMLGWLVRGKL
jgi:hydrogenase/urease accessory protein HupE